MASHEMDHHEVVLLDAEETDEAAALDVVEVVSVVEMPEDLVKRNKSTPKRSTLKFLHMTRWKP